MEEQSYEHRLKFLEQQMQVMQREINEILGQIQVAMQGLVRANSMALQVVDARLNKLETPAEKTDQNRDGVEL